MPNPPTLTRLQVIWRMILWGIPLLAAVALIAPAIGVIKDRGLYKTQERNDVMQLLTSLKAFHTEYGHFPLTQNQQFLDEATQAQLMRVLLGDDLSENPRGIVFFDVRKARQDGSRGRKYVNGLSPETGAFLDPWGNPYRLLLDSDGDGKNQSPYKDETEETRVPILAWSLGKDGIQGSPGKENILKGSDDIVSW